MKLHVCKNYDELSDIAAQIISSVITLKPNCVLGLATGSTPVGTYRRLIEMNQSGKLDFAKVRTYNLDEYYPINPQNPQSYRYFMDNQLFNHINIDKTNTHLLNGEATDTDAECASYDNAIEAAGGIDIQLLGIGNNGHIGFNEPDNKLIAATHKTALTESTINANARFFANIDEVPRYALTMGLAPIMHARKILLLASGKNKHAALAELLSGVITTSNPSTVLNLHNDVTIVCDNEAYYG
jgi:glucosamine-6-phosphate deaminase